LKKDDTISKAASILTHQECVISELRQFIHDNLIPILDLVEKERKKIQKKYLSIEKVELPSAMNDDPFQMFEYYCKVVGDKQDD
jgi:DNA-directed RNA polymerase subunit H (RpoH/RPB5)